MAQNVTIGGLSPASTVKSAVASGSWISVYLSGTKLSTLGVSVSANATGVERSGLVTITSSDGATVTLPITQYKQSSETPTATATATGTATGTPTASPTVSPSGLATPTPR